MYMDWVYNLIQTIQQQLGEGYGDQPFSVYVSYVGANLTTYTDTILGGTFDSFEAAHKQGTGALTCNVDFQPTKILINGLDDLAVPLQTPPS